MKRFVLMLAVVALVATMSPITTAHAADNVTVHAINATGQSIDIWIDSLQKTTNLVNGGGVDIVTSAGSHNVVVCPVLSQATPSTAAGCNQAAGTLAVLNPVNQGFDWAGGTNNTVVFGQTAGNPGATFGFTNDLSRTPTGNTRISLNNATGGPALNLCVDGQGQKLTAVPALPSGVAMAHGSEVDFPAGDPVSIRVSTAANCVGATAIIYTAAAGTNTVITATAIGDVCGSGCFQVLLVDAVDVANVPVQSAFCTALLSLQGIEAQFKATFGHVKAGDPATYPSKFQIKSLVDTINAAIKAGDTHVTNLEKNFWNQAVQGLEDLAAGLTAAQYDFANIPKADQQDIIDGANGVNQTPTQDEITARAALTTFAVANCLSASTVKGSGPKFTG